MNNDITNYIREVYAVANFVYSLLDAAQSDPGLPQEIREDLVWELSRLKANVADCVASLIAVNCSQES